LCSGFQPDYGEVLSDLSGCRSALDGAIRG